MSLLSLRFCKSFACIADILIDAFGRSKLRIRRQQATARHTPAFSSFSCRIGNFPLESQLHYWFHRHVSPSLGRRTIQTRASELFALGVCTRESIGFLARHQRVGLRRSNEINPRKCPFLRSQLRRSFIKCVCGRRAYDASKSTPRVLSINRR